MAQVPQQRPMLPQLGQKLGGKNGGGKSGGGKNGGKSGGGKNGGGKYGGKNGGKKGGGVSVLKVVAKEAGPEPTVFTALK